MWEVALGEEVALSPAKGLLELSARAMLSV